MKVTHNPAGNHFADVLSWQGYAVQVVKDIDAVAVPWSAFGSKNIFLSVSYLHALQDAPPSGMQFRYCTVWKDDDLVGIIYLQVAKFQASKSISYHRDTQARQDPWTRLRNAMASRVEFTTLLCGNSLVTGSHGFIFADHIAEQEQWKIVDKVLHHVVRTLRHDGIHVRLLFVKDFFHNDRKQFHMHPATRVYHGFHAQPNMIMDLPQTWKSYDDFCAALSSKYRVRVRRALKKCSEVTKRELTIDDLILHRDKIIEFYRDIADNASFNLFTLSPDYFIAVKKRLGDAFRVFGYFHREQLIAFYSFMVNGDELEAHFLGYEEHVNKEKQLYLNMLLDMIRISIELNVHRIIYGRTAMEIKSSVGAEPVHMQFYLQYQNGLINRFVPWVYGTLEPEVKWVQRRPFREEEEPGD